MSRCAVCPCRTPNILNKDPADKKPKHEKSSVSLKHEFDPTGKSRLNAGKRFYGLNMRALSSLHLRLVEGLEAVLRNGLFGWLPGLQG